VTTGRTAPGRFLFSATVELFEQYGFIRGRQVGRHAWIMSRVVAPGWARPTDVRDGQSGSGPNSSSWAAYRPAAAAARK
jgi:hypothetical protein